MNRTTQNWNENITKCRKYLFVTIVWNTHRHHPCFHECWFIILCECKSSKWWIFNHTTFSVKNLQSLPFVL
jgi:hypothetical protein